MKHLTSNDYLEYSVRLAVTSFIIASIAYLFSMTEEVLIYHIILSISIGFSLATVLLLVLSKYAGNRNDEYK